MGSKTGALGILFVAALLWSTSGVLVKGLNWNPVAIASARGLVAGLTMSLILPGGFRPRKLNRPQVFSGFCLASLSICYVSAIKLTTAANAIVLQYTAPLWVALLAPWILKEKTSRTDWIFIILIFGGVVLFFQDSLSSEGFWGNILALVSGLFFGVQALVLRFRNNYLPAGGLILGNYLTFILGLWAWSGPWPGFGDWFILILLGVFQMGIPYYLYALAVPRVTSLELVLVTMLEPVVNPVWVYLMYGEKPGPMALWGGLLVIGPVILWSLLKKRPGSGRGGLS
ncbi:MAG: DMT family transporter [Deltaproteobacteria bacterium]|jgi:drug/metabolite transporter (DMT)-like permease|nr:DMT family transporter [Deltaproteobacteria bacterium]